MPITVLYHANCPDGFGAALACWQHFGGQAQYIPVSYGQPCPEIATEDSVCIVDFSYDETTLKSLLAARLNLGKSREPYVVVLDHHASAERDLRSLQAQQLRGLHIHFDMAESGATLAWKYLHTRGQLPDKAHQPDVWAAVEHQMPRLFHYLRDRDLWQWQLDNSHAISLALWSESRQFPVWDCLATAMETDTGLERLIGEGKAIKRYADTLVQAMASHAVMSNIGGYTVPIVNATTLYSEVGDYLCTHHPEGDVPLFVAYYMDRKDGKRQWGLRGHGKIDLSVLAKQYGGGGHANAAGFVSALDWRGETL